MNKPFTQKIPLNYEEGARFIVRYYGSGAYTQTVSEEIEKYGSALSEYFSLEELDTYTSYLWDNMKYVDLALLLQNIENIWHNETKKFSQLERAYIWYGSTFRILPSCILDDFPDMQSQVDIFFNDYAIMALNRDELKFVHPLLKKYLSASRK